MRNITQTTSATVVQNKSLTTEIPMHNDDRQSGRIMNRREALALLGTAGAAMLAGRAPWAGAADPALSCVASPEQDRKSTRLNSSHG